jgi:predicted PurR-regulated permease PerM
MTQYIQISLLSIILLVIVISILFGFIIVNIINKKLTNISIKLPETFQNNIIPEKTNIINTTTTLSDKEIIAEKNSPYRESNYYKKLYENIDILQPFKEKKNNISNKLSELDIYSNINHLQGYNYENY